MIYLLCVNEMLKWCWHEIYSSDIKRRDKNPPVLGIDKQTPVTCTGVCLNSRIYRNVPWPLLSLRKAAKDFDGHRQGHAIAHGEFGARLRLPPRRDQHRQLRPPRLIGLAHVSLP